MHRIIRQQERDYDEVMDGILQLECEMKSMDNKLQLAVESRRKQRNCEDQRMHQVLLTCHHVKQTIQAS